MFAAVSATPDQKTKIQAIVKAQRAQVKAINADAKLSDADKKTKVKAARKAGGGKVEAVMTAAQKPKLAAFRKQMKAENKAKAAAKRAKCKARNFAKTRFNPNQNGARFEKKRAPFCCVGQFYKFTH